MKYLCLIFILFLLGCTNTSIKAPSLPNESFIEYLKKCKYSVYKSSIPKFIIDSLSRYDEDSFSIGDIKDSGHITLGCCRLGSLNDLCIQEYYKRLNFVLYNDTICLIDYTIGGFASSAIVDYFRYGKYFDHIRYREQGVNISDTAKFFKFLRINPKPERIPPPYQFRTDEKNKDYQFKDPTIFHALDFKHLADSMLSSIQRKTINLRFDLFSVSDLKKEEIKNNPFSCMSGNFSECTGFSFDPGSPDKALKIQVVRAKFNSLEETDKAFSCLKYLANDDKVSDGGTPGLTNMNDYVIKQDMAILWLNTGCVYSYENHKKLEGFLLRSLENKTVRESIYCKCGAVNCK